MSIPALEALVASGTPSTQALATELINTWSDFSSRLDGLPIVTRIRERTFTPDEYKVLLRNLRAQVIDGANWISRAASSFDAKATPLTAMMRDMVINHANDEKADYKMLESDYQALGGSYQEIAHAPQNIATYTLSSFLLHEATKPNPFHVLGAIFIIEGMGTIKAGTLAKAISDCPGIPPKAVTFLEYHHKNDEEHFVSFARFISMPGIADTYGPAIIKLAKAVSMLYVLQFEYLDVA